MMTGFGIGDSAIIALQTIPNGTFIPMSIIVSLMFHYMKDVYVYRLSAIIMLLGSWLRLLAFTGSTSFWVLLSSNSFFVLSAPILLNGLSRMIISWFQVRESNTATAVIGIGATFGGLLGNGIPGIFAAGLDVHDSEADLLVLKKTIYTQNGLITLVSLLFLILFKAKPVSPPS